MVKTTQPVSIANVAEGTQAEVIDVRADARDAAILRAMGLTQGAIIRVTRAGEPCIVAVMCHRGCHCAAGRIGVSRELAALVHVRAIDGA